MGAEERRRPWTLRAALVVVALLGVGLRVAAVRWNAGLLHGDVNLHALVAREHAEHGRLHYPMTFDFRPAADPDARTAPAVLHPRGVPFVAGTIARLTGLDAYAVLQGLSFAAGLAVLGLGLALAWRTVERSALGVVAAFAALATCPLLVDFSGNGSPYSGAALALVAGGLWLAHGPPGPFGRPLAHAVPYGLFAGLAMELHPTLLALALAYVVHWTGRRRELGARPLIALALAFALARLPALAWSLSNVGAPVPPLSEWMRTYRFGLVEAAVEGAGDDARVVVRALQWSALSPRRYAVEALGSAARLGLGALREGSPFLWLAAAVGALSLRTDRALRATLLPSACFLAIVLVWAKHEQRYLVGLLPAALLLAGRALAGPRGPRALRVALLAASIGTLAWFGAGLLREPPSRYDTWEPTFVRRYPEVRAMALELAREEPGVVLGFDRSALGALWWHRLPYVDAPFVRPPFDERALARALAGRHDVRYVWVHAARPHAEHGTLEDAVRAWLPVARVVGREGELVVLELERP